MQNTSIKILFEQIDALISASKAKQLIKEHIGSRIKDLLHYIPYKIVSADNCLKWSELEDKKKVLIKVKVNKHYKNFKYRNAPYRISVIFDNKTLNLVFFSKFTGYLKDLYPENQIVYITGILAVYNKKFQIKKSD